MKRAVVLATTILALNSVLTAQSVGNRPDRLEWFRDLGFGLFIHWSPDSQLGSVISHSQHPLLTGYGEDKTIR